MRHSTIFCILQTVCCLENISCKVYKLFLSFFLFKALSIFAFAKRWKYGGVKRPFSNFLAEEHFKKEEEGGGRKESFFSFFPKPPKRVSHFPENSIFCEKEYLIFLSEEIGSDFFLPPNSFLFSLFDFLIFCGKMEDVGFLLFSDRTSFVPLPTSFSLLFENEVSLLFLSLQLPKCGSPEREEPPPHSPLLPHIVEKSQRECGF